MPETDIYLDVIREACPGLCVKEIRSRNREGQFNDVLVVDGEFIFRFPRYREGVAALKTEIHLLQHLQGRLPLPVPNPVYSSLAAGAPGRAFIGYRVIPGQPLRRETLASIDDSRVLRRVAGQLAAFLKELHSLPVAGLRSTLPVLDTPDHWELMYTDVQQYLFCYMGSESQAKVRDLFEAYLNNPRLQRHRICLRHGDFGPSNILFDPGTRALSGVIDFDEAGLGDPAVDVAAVSCYGEAFFEQFCAAYPGVESLLERARFYKGTYALQEALHGFENDDRAAFESGMAAYV